MLPQIHLSLRAGTGVLNVQFVCVETVSIIFLNYSSLAIKMLPLYTLMSCSNCKEYEVVEGAQCAL